VFSRRISPWKRRKLAEREGVEPSIRNYPNAGLANRCLKPLGHLSGPTKTRDCLIGASIPGIEKCSFGGSFMKRMSEKKVVKRALEYFLTSIYLLKYHR
jgi:hypothetical protein